jgi:hypothetical protein
VRSIVLVVFLLAAWGVAMAIEEPKYEIVRTDDTIELRRYAPHLVAETEVRGDFSAVGNEAFRILFRYISGANRTSASIAMAAPVTQEIASPGATIAMTAPVTQVPTGGAGSATWVVAFAMPSSYTIATLPQPTDPRIRILEVPGRLIAARRYSGSWSKERYRTNEKLLLDAVARAGLRPLSPPTFARYNSPFTLWFLRRNEVLVEVEEPTR